MHQILQILQMAQMLQMEKQNLTVLLIKNTTLRQKNVLTYLVYATVLSRRIRPHRKNVFPFKRLVVMAITMLQTRRNVSALQIYAKPINIFLIRVVNASKYRRLVA